jgi:hypothetical protein
MCLADAEMAAALSFALQEKSAGTRRAYGSDFGIFTAWCDARGLDPMPAAAGTVARFLSSQATAGLKSSTIGRRAAATGTPSPSVAWSGASAGPWAARRSGRRRRRPI